MFGYGSWFRPSIPGWGFWRIRFGLGVGLHPTILGCGFGTCVVSVRGPPVPAPFPAPVCGVGVCAWARVSAATRHSLLQCWGVCVFVCVSHLVPCPSRLGFRCGGLCLGFGCSRGPPLQAWVLGCVCVCVRAPLVPRLSWLECAVWACLHGLRFGLCPATPGWGVRACVTLCTVPRFYPAIPGGLVVCVWVPVLSALWFSPGLRAWSRGLLCAPRPFLVSFWGGRLWRGGVREFPWSEFVPPLPFCFFFSDWCGFPPCRVLALWCPSHAVLVLGLVAPVPPSHFVQATPSCFFLLFFLPVSARARCVLACAGCPFFGWAAALGCVSPVLAGWFSGFPSEGPVCAVFGAFWLGGLPASCGVGGRLRGCGPISYPPFFFLGGSACSSLGLPWAGARTGRHSVWLTGKLLVPEFCWA